MRRGISMDSKTRSETMSTQKLALVTGGAQGIGYACAEALKEDGYGVILADINADGVAEAAERLGAVAGLACDMADAAAVKALFDRIEADHGPVSSLVNNAGIAMPGDFLDYDLDAFDKVIAVNLRGTFVATQRAARARSEEHTSELQSLRRISYAVFCLKKKKGSTTGTKTSNTRTHL